MCKKMNQVEKYCLKEASKNGIKKEFANMCEDKWKNYKQYLEKKDVLEALIILLNAEDKEDSVELNFQNEYIGNGHCDNIFIYGEDEISLDYDNVLAIIPNEEFIYSWDDADITDLFVSNTYISSLNMYSGKISYAGIIEEGSDLSYSKLKIKIKIYYIDKNSAAWKRYFAESYRLYESKQYKIAFLHAFIGFENLVEYMNDVLKKIYLVHQNEMSETIFRACLFQKQKPVSVLEEEILDSESYKRLKHLEKENRKLIDDKLTTILRYVNDLEEKKAHKKIVDFKFYENLRNILAHGDSLQRSDLTNSSLYKKYKSGNGNDMDFEKVYVDFFEKIGNIIEQLVEEKAL